MIRTELQKNADEKAISSWDRIGLEIAIRACVTVDAATELFRAAKYSDPKKPESMAKPTADFIVAFHGLYLQTCGYASKEYQKHMEQLFLTETRWTVFYQEFLNYIKFCHEKGLTKAATESEIEDARNIMRRDKR